MDNFFSDLDNTKPFLKVALEGFAGCGKTYTAAELAIGLHHRIGSEKPIVIFDSEKAAKFLRTRFENAGIKAVVRESRDLADLREAMKRCREGYSDILIIDSISHVWEGFLETYKQKKRSNRLEFQDWGIIKPLWKQEFATPFVLDPVHVIMTGRAGYEYENEKNEETGKREIYKSGIKMKVEGETAYEPDILVLMERFEEILDENKKVWREATILKDRAALIDGKTFKNPTFQDFLPSIEVIIADPKHKGSFESGNTAGLIQTEEDRREWTRQRDIALEKIEGELTAAWPGQTVEAKKQKVLALEEVFATKSWTEISRMTPDQLNGLLPSLRDHIIRITSGANS